MTHTPDACQVRQPSSATSCAHLASSPSASGSKSKVVCCHPSMVAEAMWTIRRTTGVWVHLAATPAWDSGLAYSRTNRSKTPAACLAGLVVEHMSVDTQGDGRVGVPEPAGHNMHNPAPVGIRSAESPQEVQLVQTLTNACQRIYAGQRNGANDYRRRPPRWRSSPGTPTCFPS